MLEQESSIINTARETNKSCHNECNAKSNKNAIRLALNIHILWHHLDIALQQLTAPMPRQISESTMAYALMLHDTLPSFGGVAEAVSLPN